MKKYSKKEYKTRFEAETYYLISKKKEPRKGLFKIDKNQLIE